MAANQLLVPIFCGGLLACALLNDSQALSQVLGAQPDSQVKALVGDRKSTRLNSSHANISYAVFCLKKKKKTRRTGRRIQSHRQQHLQAERNMNSQLPTQALASRHRPTSRDLPPVWQSRGRQVCSTR